MDWKVYEEITKHIYETLGKSVGVIVICHGNDCKVKGKSGVEHQIDVLTQHSDALHSYKTAIECKYWDKNINKDIVLKVAEIVEDANLNKGVVVSKKGFTPDGIEFAKYRNIGLVELREMTADDWEGKLKNIHVTVNVLIPEILGVELIIEKETVSKIEKGSNLPVDSLSIEKETGEIVAFRIFVEDFQYELREKGENELFEKVYPFNRGTVIMDKLSKEKMLINGIKLKGRLNVGTTGFEIRGEDHIWLTMKLIFENKMYSIGKDKTITER